MQSAHSAPLKQPAPRARRRCLQKTAPPVLIFAESKTETDDIHEYLMLKGVGAVGIHGGKDQSEREYAIATFKDGRKDVLVGTDVASKGLDFPEIQHVINFDMPKTVEDYVHRIGRSGRAGASGYSISFFTQTNAAMARDLVKIMREAEQEVPRELEDMAHRGGRGGKKWNPYARNNGGGRGGGRW